MAHAASIIASRATLRPVNRHPSHTTMSPPQMKQVIPSFSWWTRTAKKSPRQSPKTLPSFKHALVSSIGVTSEETKPSPEANQIA